MYVLKDQSNHIFFSNVKITTGVRYFTTFPEFFGFFLLRHNDRC
jgi:hypothetical protein